MTKGQAYKHKNNTDVTMYVRSATPSSAGWELKVLWINIVNPLNIWLMAEDEVFVKAKDTKDWQEYP